MKTANENINYLKKTFSQKLVEEIITRFTVQKDLPENIMVWCENQLTILSSEIVKCSIPYKWEVYSILPGGEKGDFWVNIGNGFRNKESEHGTSFTILLNALPINRKLHFRIKKEEKKENE